MSKAIRVHQTGDASVMKFEEVEVAPPGPGEVQLRHTAIGVNFIDVYNRSGLYTLPLPFTPGQEGAGVVTALGDGVTTLKLGQRVAYAGMAGAYAEVRNVKAEKLVVLPDGISDQLAASVMLKGMTAHMLLKKVRPVGKGDTILIHAAAGGVGLLATQWAKHLGAKVIGAVGTPSKVALAAPNCDHVIIAEGPWSDKVKSLTGGAGVQVVYDSVGKDTIAQSLEVLAPRGMLVSFGQSSGKPPPIDILSLGGPRSLFLSRPSMHAWVHTRAELEEASGALFEVMKSGAVKVNPPKTFALSAAADAHRALEGRQTSGSVVLLPLPA